MAKRLLIETRMNALSLCESVADKPKRPGCLGTLKGPCADLINPTRNKNFYSRKLWENVFKDPLVKESLEDRVLIGELDHPGDRLETHAKHAAIVMTGYEFNDDEGVLDGTFDILDTPNGRILKSLVDYGCKIGVSSRGEGDVTTNTEGVDVVDEDTYYFVCFDAVALPAVKKAKPSLQESLKRESLKESLLSQIDSVTAKSELDTIKKVIESAQLPEIDSLMESIDNKSKELEGINDSSRLLEDLEKSSALICDLNNEIKELKQEVTNCKSRNKRLLTSRSGLIEECGRQATKLESLKQEYSDAIFKASVMAKKVESLKESLAESNRVKDSLEESLSQAEKVINESESQIKNLTESLEKSQASVRQKNDALKSLRKEMETANESLSQKLRESQKSARQMRTSLEESRKSELQNLQVYARKRSQESGLNPKVILESLKQGMTTSDVDRIVENEVSTRDRYRKVPVTDDALLRSLSESVSVSFPNSFAKEDEESRQTIQFMEQFYNNKKG